MYWIQKHHAIQLEVKKKGNYDCLTQREMFLIKIRSYIIFSCHLSNYSRISLILALSQDKSKEFLKKKN